MSKFWLTDFYTLYTRHNIYSLFLGYDDFKIQFPKNNSYFVEIKYIVVRTKLTS